MNLHQLTCLALLLTASTMPAESVPQPRLPPIEQIAEISSPGKYHSGFGSVVAASGNILVVATSKFGSRVYVFIKPRDGWKNERPLGWLDASDRLGDEFGISVAIAGDTVVVGSLSIANRPGGAYVFTRPKAGWPAGVMHETAKLTASDGAVLDGFGQAVAIAENGNAIVVGAPQVMVGSNAGQGAAYVFVKPPGGWKSTTETMKITASDGQPMDGFGYSVSLTGNTLAVGAPNLGRPDGGGGKAYVFVKNGGRATQAAVLTPSDGVYGDGIGWSVSASTGAVVAGAPFQSQSGAQYLWCCVCFCKTPRRVGEHDSDR